MLIIYTFTRNSFFSPSAKQVNLIYSRDHSVEQSLEYQAAWNGGMLQTKDIPVAVQAAMEKSKPQFSKL